jgi:3-oxoacyl-[acyl-carrier-protein] synthase II
MHTDHNQTIENFDTQHLACKVAAQVPRGDGPNDFRSKDWIDPKNARSQDVDFIAFAIAAG